MAKERNPCTVCGRAPKRKGHARWCMECWLERQPIMAREEAAAGRLKLIPDHLRKRVVPERLWPPGRRWCGGCQTFVLLENVSGSRCKTCASRAGHRARVEAEYGIPREVFDALWRLQGGRCALCGRRLEARRPGVDHDHRTGAVRGLLCPDPDWGCNLKVLPRFDAYPDGPVAMAQRLIDYIEHPPAGKLQDRA